MLDGEAIEGLIADMSRMNHEVALVQTVIAASIPNANFKDKIDSEYKATSELKLSPVK